jgi:two-component system NtrC family sensor kinase
MGEDDYVRDDLAGTPPATLRRLAESSVRSPFALVMARLDGMIEWVNPSFTRLTGFTAADAIGHHRFDLLHGPVARSGEIERMLTQIAAGRHIATEFQTLTKDGRLYWTSFAYRPGLENGKHTYYVMAEEDITIRRRNDQDARTAARRAEAFSEALRAEQSLLANVLSTIPHVVFWKDTEHRYLGCNDAYARLRGVSGHRELAGRREAEMPVEDGLGPVIAALEEQVLATGEPVVDHKVGVRGADGEHRMLLLSVIPRYGDGDATEGIIGVGTDVTRISMLEQQLAQATRLESIGQLAAGLAHEINTPVQYVSDNVLFLADSFTDVLDALRAIANVARGVEQDPAAATVANIRLRLQTLVDGLDLGFLATEIPSALEQTLEGVGRVAEIIRAMKEFSHPGLGRADTDLNRAMATTAQVCRNEWKYVAELHLDLDPEVGMVPCYEGELKQVVLNLIVNSAHAVSDRRAAAGTVELGRIDIATQRDADTIRIRITDDGTGMDEATKLRIFDPFFTTKEVGKGTGQGLALARRCIVGKHGGSIDVVTAVGQGTTFTLNLPADVEPDTDVEPETDSDPGIDGDPDTDIETGDVRAMDGAL